ncbi:four and a half LIM domains protein 5 isoform X2 [Python bivittatus]|uniref:Four and a half LIM domains protein 5 isoform X2 n=1 Tax=Python bivittatus TaxID=176946 RepID=A0A9F5IIQ2_PYTBI|nr:four and a half LIM domains protein 5 isoform X2 [Python bivittatus]XP_025025495.1 four and a half LIM domains protein 5 isoform X2 [Python bivittatus]
MASDQSNCFHCKDSLCGKQYTMKEENAFCVKCYDSLFAHFCEKCQKPIECDAKELAYKGCHWHETCFKCAKCHHSLVEKPFAAKDELLLCTACYSNEYSSKCFHCKRTIMPGSRKMEFKGNCWHEACFVCQFCRQPLGTKPLITKDDDNYCVPCYEKQFAQCCYSCKKVIPNGGVTYRDQPWHKECFLCTGCKKQLAGHRFISKDEHPYCLECFRKHFAKKCAACTEPITALGGGKFISFEDRQWHSDCFKCSKCTCSLVGKGFLAQQDEILCCSCGCAT